LTDLNKDVLKGYNGTIIAYGQVIIKLCVALFWFSFVNSTANKLTAICIQYRLVLEKLTQYLEVTEKRSLNSKRTTATRTTVCI